MKCRSCQSENITEFLDLGEQYVSDFRTDNSKPPKYPLQAVICENCMLVQLNFTTPSGEMYHKNYGFKSGISNSIKNDLKDVVSTALEYQENPRTWLDIASNDGTLLSFVPQSIYRVGVDPIEKYCKEAEAYADKIINGFFTAGGHKSSGYDVITSISCFYDMDDPNKFVVDVEQVLANKGIWVIQQNYLLTTMQLGAVDNFCHEHLEYYTLLSLEHLLKRHGLEVIDISTSMVNGGSLRTIVARQGDYPVQDSVEIQRTIEVDAGINKLETYKSFSDSAMKNIQDLKNLVDKLKNEDKNIAILAASTRGATIWQCAGFTDKQIDYAIERNPEKVGKMFSAIGVPIISEEEARKRNPDYMIIGPWFFADEIVDREKDYLEKGGKLIQPLPTLGLFECKS